MEKRKIIQWLRRLAPEERHQFSEFLRSSLHSNRPQLGQMMDLLIAFFFDQPGEEVSNEAYWALVYPDKPYNANLLNRLLSEMTGELKSFLGLLQYQKDVALQQVSLMREYRERDWEDVIPKEIVKAHTKLDAEIPRNEEYYHAKLQLAVERMYYDSQNLGKVPGPIFQDNIDKLEIYFVLRLLKFRMYSSQHDRMHRTDHKIRFQAQLWPEFAANNLPESEMVSIYWLVEVLKLEKDQVKSFEEYLDLLMRITPDYQNDPGPHRISKQECEDLYIVGQNHCTLGINRGENQFGEYFIKLNSKGLKSGVLLTTGQVKAVIFVQMIIPLIKLKKFQWAQDFIQNYSHLIRQEERESTILFLNASIYFAMGKYTLAKKYFLKTKNLFSISTPLGINLNLRQMLCRLYFEEGDFEAFLYEANAFLTFTRRNKFFSQAKFRRYQEFVRLSKSLERIIHSPSGEKKTRKLLALKDEVSSAPALTAKSWLLEKIENEMGLNHC